MRHIGTREGGTDAGENRWQACREVGCTQRSRARRHVEALNERRSSGNSGGGSAAAATAQRAAPKSRAASRQGSSHTSVGGERAGASVHSRHGVHGVLALCPACWDSLSDPNN